MSFKKAYEDFIAMRDILAQAQRVLYDTYCDADTRAAIKDRLGVVANAQFVVYPKKDDESIVVFEVNVYDSSSYGDDQEEFKKLEIPLNIVEARKTPQYLKELKKKELQERERINNEREAKRRATLMKNKAAAEKSMLARLLKKYPKG
jgi:hypothetical protein